MGKMSNLDLDDEKDDFLAFKSRANITFCVANLLQMLNSKNRKKIHRQFGEEVCKDLEFALTEIWHAMDLDEKK